MKLRIPPMWKWKPALLRRVAMIPYVPISLLLNIIILPLLIFVIAGVIAGWQELFGGGLNWMAAFKWCRDTWRGQPYRPYD